MNARLTPLASPRLVPERFTDAQIEAWRVRHIDLGDRYEANALTELLALREAFETLKWIAAASEDIPDNWDDDHQCMTECGHFRRAARAVSKAEVRS